MDAKETAYHAAYRAEHRDEILAKKRIYQAENRDRLREYHRLHYQKNRAARLEQRAEYAIRMRAARDPEFMARQASARMKRIARERMALAAWADAKLIRDLYKLAAIYRAAGVDCHVDHVVPLAGELACGLHTHDNLTVILASQNMAKGNRFQVTE